MGPLLGLTVLGVTAAASAAEAPPPAPYKGGPTVEGTLGMYAPTGRLKHVTSPGPWVRVTAGWEFVKWLGVFAAADAAFLSTDRGSPPPGERGYVLWGFGGGLRAAAPLGARVRIPVRLELGLHKADDGGVLSTYGFDNAHTFRLSWGASIGFEWRALSRHFGIALEGGVRSDAATKSTTRSDSPLAIVAGAVLRYTL